MKSRYVWLTETDWREFAAILAEVFPTLRYHDLPSWQEAHRPEPPDVTTRKFLFESRNIFSGGDIIGAFDPDWQPEYRREERSDQPELSSWVPSRRIKNPAFLIQMLRPIWTAEKLNAASFMEYGVITFYRDPGNHEHDLLSRHFYRLLGKVCTNRNQVQISIPDRRLLFDQPKGSLFWLGHDALRWARENPERVFFYNSRDWAIRPAA